MFDRGRCGFRGTTKGFACPSKTIGAAGEGRLYAGDITGFLYPTWMAHSYQCSSAEPDIWSSPHPLPPSKGSKGGRRVSTASRRFPRFCRDHRGRRAGWPVHRGRSPDGLTNGNLILFSDSKVPKLGPRVELDSCDVRVVVKAEARSLVGRLVLRQQSPVVDYRTL